METTSKQPERISCMSEQELCKYVLETTRGKDLFPSKTARARKWLEALNKNTQQ